MAHRWLGVAVALPAELDRGFVGAASEWRDGVRLAQTVEACEVLRGGRRGEGAVGGGSGANAGALAGVERAPKSRAASLANWARALQVLRQLPAMPLDLLYSEARLASDARAVRRLLLQVRRAYGHHLRSHFHALVPVPVDAEAAK